MFFMFTLLVSNFKSNNGNSFKIQTVLSRTVNNLVFVYFSSVIITFNLITKDVINQ